MGETQDLTEPHCIHGKAIFDRCEDCDTAARERLHPWTAPKPKSRTKELVEKHVYDVLIPGVKK